MAVVVPTSVVPGKTRYLGLGLESSFAVEAAATRYFDIQRTSLDSPSDQARLYEGVGSRIPTLAIPGPYIPRGDIELGIGPKNFGLILRALFGGWMTKGTDPAGASTTLAAAVNEGDTTIVVNSEAGFAVNDFIQIGTEASGDAEVLQIQTLDGGAGPTYTWTLLKAAQQKSHASGAQVKEVTSPFTHIFFPIGERNLPSLTARNGKEVLEHIFLGTTFNEAEFSIERNGFATARLSSFAQKDKKVALDTSAKSFESQIYTGRHITVFQWETDVPSSTDLLPYAESIRMQVSNNIDPEAGVRFGSRFPKEFEVQGVTLSASFNLAFNSTEEYERFWGGATEPSESNIVTERLVLVLTSGSDSLTFWYPRAYVSAATAEMTGRNRIVQAITAQPLYDATWFNATKVDMVNHVDRY